MSSPRETHPRRSQNPPPNVVEPARVGGGATERRSGDASYAAVALRLVALFAVVLTERARAFLLGTLSVEKARALGMRASPSDVVDEFARCLVAYAPLIATRRLPGYGPLRARFGAELVRGVAAGIDRYEAQQVAVRGAAGERDGAMELTDAMRDAAVAGLRCLSGDDAALGERVRSVAEPASSVAGHLRSVESIAREVEQARENVPPELLDDAGLTAEVLDAMQSSTRGASRAREQSAEARQAQQRLRAELAEPCGRIYQELRTLLAAARAARKRDRTVPSVSSWLVTRPARTRRSPAPQPTPAPQPAPTPDNG